MPARVQAAAARYPHARIVPAADHAVQDARPRSTSSSSRRRTIPTRRWRTAALARWLPRRDRQAVRDVSAHEARELAALAARARQAGDPLPEPALGRRHPDAAAAAARRRARRPSTATSRATSAGVRLRKRAGRKRAPTSAAKACSVDLTVHLVDQALLLFGPRARVYAEFERRHPAGRTWWTTCSSPSPTRAASSRISSRARTSASSARASRCSAARART